MPLKDLLLQFLIDGTQPVDLPLKAKILSFEPMFISDDNTNYLEIVHITDNIDTEMYQKDVQIKNFELVIPNWKFVFRRVPTSHEYYFDIQASNFEINEVEEGFEENLEWSCLNEDSDIKYYSDLKKRQAIETLLENNLRIKNVAHNDTPVKISASATKLEESELQTSNKKDSFIDMKEHGVGDLLELNDIFEGNSFENYAAKSNEIDPRIYEGDNKQFRTKAPGGNLRAMSEKEIKAKAGLGIMYEGLKNAMLSLQDLTFNRATVDCYLDMYETKKKLKIY